MATILASSTIVLSPLFLQNKVSAGTFPTENGQIAFTLGVGNRDIYVMDADGSNVQRLTNK